MSAEVRRVAVVVFCEVVSETQEDAENVASLAVRRGLGGGESGTWPADLSTNAYGLRWSVTAKRVLEVGIAAGNGYLWTQPTIKGWHS